jgi:hypothetical protein
LATGMIIVGGGGRSKVDRAESARGDNELDKLVVATLEPLRAVRSGESGLKGERKTGGIKV